MKTWGPRSGLVLALLAIALATLVPNVAGGYTAPFWCVLCGDRSADVVRNILLFLPLGAMLRLRPWRPGRVIGVAALLSFGIEMTQFVIPGRDPSVADLVANTLGAALGAWMAGAPGAWLTPVPARAARLALAWGVFALAVLAAGRVLMVPSLPASRYYGQWVPQLGTMAWYGGSVRQARLGARSLPDGPLDASAAVRGALLAGDTLLVDAIAGPPTRTLAPIFSIADEAGRDIVLAGAEGEDLVFRFRSRATWLRFEQPSVRLPGAFTGVRGGADIAIRAWKVGPDLCLDVNRRRACPGFDPRHGWAFLVPEKWLDVRERRVAGVAWIVGLLSPLCYWLALALRSSSSRAAPGRVSGGTG